MSSVVSQLSRTQTVGIVAGLQLTLLLAALDQTVVTTAIPRIVAELNGFPLYAWTTTAYLAASTIAIPIFGRVSDLFGRKLVFIIGLIAFTVSSWVCGMAGHLPLPINGMEQLIAGRSIQGLAGGIIMVLTFAVVGDIFSPAERGKYQGFFAAVFAAASLAGPTLGGWLTEQLSWRWAFFINIPVAILALIVLYIFMPADDNRTESAQELFPRSLFKNTVVLISCLSVFVTGIGMFGSLLLLPLLMQSALNLSATTSGALLAPLMIVVALSSIAGGLLVAKTGRYKLLCLSGLAIMCAGVLMLSSMTVDTPVPPLMVNMVVIGIGMGLLLPVYTIVIQNVARKETMGIATALSQFFRSVGGTVGTALFGWLMQLQYDRDVASGIGQQQSLVHSIDFVFLIYAVILAVTFLSNLALRELPLCSKNP